LSNQVRVVAESRAELGKGPTGRLRKQGRVPGVMYGYQVEPTAVHVDALELYHALHTEAGSNVLIRLEVDGETHLTVARDRQRHPVRGDTLHVDFLAVDRDSPIAVEVPVHLVGEDDFGDDGGILNQILYTVPMLVKPLEVPNYVELSVAALVIGDVKRVQDLADQLPAGAEFDIDPERTVVTVNAPISEEEFDALEGDAGASDAAAGGDDAGDEADSAAEDDDES